ncbi:hypothetical protein Cgig2_005490 [Carnegiea gigantea]|uniref:MULE transposase domain-containing protein n=1 Tax=Carnegiea gigantea TaxID=171969 RepID=A0A9Q1QGB9_9CARY|nr:hypothetical protein Cgig2_005490 [Carnegiea gigantea]
MALDGNNGQFLLSYGIAPQENEEEWSYFLDGLARALDARENSSNYIIVSDRHKGIIKALKNVMPQASRRICVLHFYKNFAAHYPGIWFHYFFYIAANAYSSFVRLKKFYENIIHPISDPCMWGDINFPTLDPPVELRKRGRPEKYNRRESTSWAPVPQPEGQAIRYFSGTKRCKQCKQLGHTNLTCGRPRDESGRLLEKYKKKRKTSTRPIGRPRKTLCTTGTSTGTSDPTSTVTKALPTQFTYTWKSNAMRLCFAKTELSQEKVK